MVTEALWECGGSTENLNSISQYICKKWSQQNEYQLGCSHKSPFSNMWSLSIQSHWEKITTVKLSCSFRRKLVKMLQGHLWGSEVWGTWWDSWFEAYLSLNHCSFFNLSSYNSKVKLCITTISQKTNQKKAQVEEWPWSNSPRAQKFTYSWELLMKE